LFVTSVVQGFGAMLAARGNRDDAMGAAACVP
jgi:hypothetical protein